MHRRIPLFYNGIPTGSVSVSRDKSRHVFCAECPDTINGLTRAYVCMPHNPEHELCVGVMVPEEGGVLRARRSCTKNDLAAAGIDFGAINRGEIRLCKSFIKSETDKAWEIAAAPEKIFNDVVLRSALKGCDVLVEQDISTRRIAARLCADKPFALAPVFCFARPIYINRALYGVVELNRARLPVMPE